jgi:hypothetical protein
MTVFILCFIKTGIYPVVGFLPLLFQRNIKLYVGNILPVVDIQFIQMKKSLSYLNLNYKSHRWFCGHKAYE